MAFCQKLTKAYNLVVVTGPRILHFWLRLQLGKKQQE